jgi:hypothetical protein
LVGWSGSFACGAGGARAEALGDAPPAGMLVEVDATAAAAK